MGKLRVGIITVNDGCSLNDEVDIVGAELVRIINGGALRRSEVVKACVLPEDMNALIRKMSEWSDTDNLHLILTVGGLEGQYVKRATSGLLDRQFPGMMKLLEAVPIRSHENMVCGFRRNTVLVNLPGDIAASKCCLRLLGDLINHSIFLLTGFGTHLPRQIQQL